MKTVAKISFIILIELFVFSLYGQSGYLSLDACAYPTNTSPDEIILYGGQHTWASDIGYSPDGDITTLGDVYSVNGVVFNTHPDDPEYAVGPYHWSGAYLASNFSYGCGVYFGQNCGSPDAQISCDLARSMNQYMMGQTTDDYDQFTEQHDKASFSVTYVEIPDPSEPPVQKMSAAGELLDPFTLSHDMADDDHANTNCPPDNDSANGTTASDDSNNGDNDDDVPDGDAGMPRWYISQPYLNLWVQDTPVFYNTSLGKRITFHVAYKQRDTRPLNTTVPPTGWGHNWFSYIHFVVPTYLSGTNTGAPGGSISGSVGPVSLPSSWTFTNDFNQWRSILYTTEGGQDYFDYGNPVESKSSAVLLPLNGNAATGFKLVHTDGSVDEYSIVSSPTYSFGIVTNQGRIYDLGSTPPNFFSFASVAYYNNDGTFIHSADISTIEPPIGAKAGFVACDALLTKRIDPYGNAITLNYNSDSHYRLQSIVDYDGKTTTLTYGAEGMLTGVSMPYGRTAAFSYAAPGQMTSITDAQGMSSSFSYAAAAGVSTNIYLATLTTPYGTTSFAHYDASPIVTITNPPSIQTIVLSDGSVSHPIVRNGTTELYVGWCGGPNRVNRACTVTYPDGTHELYMYRYDSRNLVAETYPGYEIPYGALLQPDDGLDPYNEDPAGSISHLLSTRNSFHWNRQQYPLLSTNDIQQLTPHDYAIGTMEHWLEEDITETAYPYASEQNVSGQLSMIRAASPDGIQEGAKTWLDNNSKVLPWAIQSNPDTVIAATILPAGGIRKKTTSYSSDGLLNNITESYTDQNGNDSERSTIYSYYATTMPGVPWINRSRPAGINPPDNFGGISIQYYDDEARETVQDAVGNTTTYYFNSRHQIAGIQHANGLITTNLYGSDGFLQASIDLQSGATNHYSFSNGLPSSTTSPLGLQLNYAWDNLSRLKQVSFQDGTTISNNYDRLDLVDHKDRLNHWTHASYDTMDQLASSTDANGHTSYYSYCYCGGLGSITDPLSNATEFLRDYNGNVIEALSTDGFVTTYHRDILGQLINLTNSAGLNLNYTYNNQGLVTHVSSAVGTLLAVTYDDGDRPIRITDAQGVTITNNYDAIGRILYRQNAFGFTEQNSYAVQGISWHRDALSHYNYYNYDDAGRLAGTTDANGHTNGFTYNPLGQLATLTDGNGHVTSWAYDMYGRNIAKTNGNGTVVNTNGYDAKGRLTAHWTPAKGLTQYTYDANGNPLTTTYSSGTGITATYDALNRLHTLSDAMGSSGFTYQNYGAFRGALAIEDGPWTADAVTRNRVNHVPQSLTLEQPSGSWTENYGYDSLLRLHRLVSPAGGFTYTYNGAGNQIRTLALPGSSIYQTYDAVGQLLTTALKQGSTILDAQSYAYDLNGQRTSVQRTDHSLVNYGYDSIGQVTSAVGLEPDGLTVRGNENFSYGYDPAGNLLGRTNNTLTQAFTTDGANQLVNIGRNDWLTVAGGLTQSNAFTVNDQTAAIYHDLTFAVTNGVALNDGLNTFTAVVQQAASFLTNTWSQTLPASVNLAYDLNGNLIGDGQHGFDYDCANELTRITTTNAWKTEFVYDGLGRRRTKLEYGWTGSTWTLTNTVRYVYDGMAVIQERDGNNVPLVSYTRSSDSIGGLLARTDLSTTNSQLSTSFYHADGNGNITMLVDAAGNKVARYLYDSYGNLIDKRGILADANTYRFSSKEVDVKSGLYYYGYRYYQPNLQRWLNTDPIAEAGGINLYCFVGNGPITKVDSFGLLFTDEQMGNRGVYGLPTVNPDEYEAGLADIGDAINNANQWIAHNIKPGNGIAGAEIESGLGGLINDLGNDLLGNLEKPNPCPPKDPSTPIGRSGNPAGVPKGNNTPEQIGGRDYSGHALDEMQSDGIPPSVVENTISNGNASEGNTPSETVFNDPVNGVSVVVDTASGKVVTTFRTGKK